MIMNPRIKYPYLIILLVQLVLVIIAFKNFRIHPEQIIFCNSGDGLKNYFTLLSYVKWPGHNLFQYNAFNYPFGEFIFTTDNTPLFAIPFKWFCQHITDLSDYTLPIYNTFIILNIVACGLLCFAVLRKILKHDLIALMMSIVLSWTNIQVIRIWRGHFNLSLSSFAVLAILLTIVWMEQSGSRKKQLLTAFGIIVVNYLGFFAHGYYIAILGVFQAAVLSFFGIYRVKSSHGKISLIASILIPIVSLIFIFITIRLADGFYHLRTGTVDGYDWMETKIRFFGLFTHYDFHSFFFPFKNMRGSYETENMGYLGNVGLYALLFLTIASVASKPFREKLFLLQRRFFTTTPTAPLFFGCLLMLIISFGEHYYTEDLNGGFLIYNFLNPLYLIHQFSDAVTQFRALGRFAWPFFWGFNIWMLYCIVGIFPGLSKQWRLAVIATIVFLGGSEVKDYVDTMQGRASQKNLLDQEAYQDIKHLKIDFSRYQAMLALPYYNVGISNMNYTLDDYEPTSVFSYQMALYTKLPLMNVKLSRTVLQQAQMLDTLLAYDYMSKEIAKRMNDKPVLVFINRDNANQLTLNNRPVAGDIQTRGLDLPARHRLQPIDSLGSFVFYEWYPKNSF
jgi:hypothetical protein